jgi:signal transduction histidine kinase/ligand-binding sensor domain-containing protein
MVTATPTLVGSVVGAQDVQRLREPAEFAIDQWTTEHGLPQNSVNAILQMPDGYLLVGTFGGLARFDGTRFTPLERVDGAGRHMDRVLSLAAGTDGSIWIGTEAGLLRRRGNVYELYTQADGLPGDEIRALHVDSRGTLWISAGADGFARYAGGVFASVREVAGRRIGYVSDFTEDAHGTLWVILTEGALHVAGGELAHVQWLDGTRPAKLVLHDRAGDYWYDFDRATVRVSGDEVRAFRVRGAALMVEDAEAGYWVGTVNDGLFHYTVEGDSAVVRQYALPDGRPGFLVRSAWVDADGNAWFGTNADGLLRARRKLFRTYTTAHGLSHDVVTAVLGDRDGQLWVGTNCGGVNEMNLAVRTVRVSNPRSPGDPEGDPCVFSLTQDAAGTVWQGTYGGGVSALPRAGGARRVEVPGLWGRVILALFTAADGTVWAGSKDSGLFAIREGRVAATYTTAEGLVHNGVRTILQTRDGALWIGTTDGLSRFSDGGFTNFTAADGLASTHVRSIHEDDDGTLWIGTYGGGLHRYRHGAFQAITQRDGLADDVVSAILEDDAGRFWMSGNRGVHVTARDQLNAFADGRTQRVHSVLYGRADGLRNPETSGGFQPAAWKDGRGHLWFPTVQGVAVVDPGRATAGGRPPSVVIEAVVVDGEVRPASAAVAVGPGSPNVEFRYAGLSLSTPEHIRFRYRLEGFDAGWTDAGSRAVAYYPRLPAGTYRFVVMAANRDGVWGEAQSAVALRVAPPVWDTLWFRVLGGLVVLILVLAFVRRRTALARAERMARESFSRQLIESQENERRRLAGELHDGLGQELLIVRNRALIALRSTGLDVRARDQIQQITDVVTGSLSNIRALAHNLTPHQLDHLGVTTALRTMVDAVAESCDVEFDVSIDPIDGMLTPENQINLYRVLQEALSNIVHHSGARRAEVAVQRGVHGLSVRIADDGCGFAADAEGRAAAMGGFGLSGMAERARIMGGALSVWSAPGRGTRIELAMPVAAPAPREPAPENAKVRV